MKLAPFFLNKYLDYRCNWQEHYSETKPAQIRIKQLEALLKALDIRKEFSEDSSEQTYVILGKELNENKELESEEMTRKEYLKDFSELEYFKTGQFIEDNPKGYPVFLSRITTYAMEHHKHLYERDSTGGIRLSWVSLWQNILKFRVETYKLTRPSRGFLMGYDFGVYYVNHLADNLKELIKQNTQEIDEAICLLIDPSEQEISIETLMKDFDYPNPDLKRIDSDWEYEFLWGEAP